MEIVFTYQYIKPNRIIRNLEQRKNFATNDADGLREHILHKLNLSDFSDIKEPVHLTINIKLYSLKLEIDYSFVQSTELCKRIKKALR